MLQDPSPRRRWPRSQLFSLSAKGTDAEARYRTTIIASRAQEGRASFDAARSAWAAAFRVQPDDGLYLGEARSGPIKLEQLVEALETCGKTRKDAVAALERLVDAELLSTASSP
jgi:hypothetical protein